MHISSTSRCQRLVHFCTVLSVLYSSTVCSHGVKGCFSIYNVIIICCKQKYLKVLWGPFYNPVQYSTYTVTRKASKQFRRHLPRRLCQFSCPVLENNNLKSSLMIVYVWNCLLCDTSWDSCPYTEVQKNWHKEKLTFL